MLFSITETNKYHAVTIAGSFRLCLDIFYGLGRGDDIVSDPVDRCTVLIYFVEQTFEEIYQDRGFEIRMLVSFEIALGKQVAIASDEIS